MADKKKKDIPVYLFTGFLDAGKTRFIRETLADPRFNNGERTLLLLCEEGEEEYGAQKNLFIEPVEEPEDVNSENFAVLLEKHSAERVLVEYNGMWMLDDLFRALPDGWLVYQEFMFADANSFVSYNANMRQLVYDKLKSCELAVFNRCGTDVDEMAIHQIVRAVSRRCDIAYEAPDGSVRYDEIEDPLPFDLDADVIDIADRDFALWYRDLGEEMEKYAGKTVHFKGVVAKSPVLQSDCFVIGRMLMTCCEADTQYVGLVCRWPDARLLAKGEWVEVTASIEIKWHKGYGRKGPVLTASAIAPCEPPAQKVATFY